MYLLKLLKPRVQNIRNLTCNKCVTAKSFSVNSNEEAPLKLQTKLLNFFQSTTFYQHNTLQLINEQKKKSEHFNLHFYAQIVEKNNFDDLNNKDLILFFNELYLDPLKSKNIQKTLQLLDKECSIRFNQLSLEEILKMLDIFFFLNPRNFIRLNFYNKFINTLMNTQFKNICKYNLIKCVFYLGLSKSKTIGQNLMADPIVLKIDNLLPEELCILLDASFKLNYVLPEEILNKLVKVFAKNPLVFFEEPAYLVVLAKVFRRNNKYINYGFLKDLADSILKFESLVKKFTFTANAHILVLFAQNYFYEKNSFNLLIDVSNQALKIDSSKYLNVHFSKRIRAKDICRMLWSLSHFGICYEEASEIIDRLLLETHTRFKENEFEPHEMIDTLLSLVMLCDPINKTLETLLDEAFTDDLVDQVLARNKIRYDARLNLLLKCIKIEKPHLINIRPKKINIRIRRQIESELEKRKELKNVWYIVEKLKKEFSFSYVECRHSISNIYIAGIMAYSSNGRPIAIELLDNQVCLYGCERPNGLMKLKLRLLQSLRNQHIILIKKSELQKCAYKSDLINLIDNKLKIIVNN